MLSRSLAVGLVGAALLLAGCGGGGESVTGRAGADSANGKTLFSQTCGGCHVLADAGTAGTIGPNLDNAFGYACKQGFDEETFYEVVRLQIDIPAREGQMPADLVTGQDAVDVSAYVASAAGKNVEGCAQDESGAGTTTTGG